MNDDDLRRQLLTRLDGLRAAGLDWLPHAPALIAAATPAPVRQASLLDADEPAPPAPLDERREGLRRLALEVSGCTRCPELCSTRTQTVFGVGDAGVELCLVGEAPGADEDARGEPFVGAAGQLLNRILTACGLQREEVYICNTLKCRPPGNRTPQPQEIANCRGYLEAQLDLVRPKYLLALGGSAAQSLLQTTTSLGKLRGRFHDYRGIPTLVTYHPAFLLPHRSPAKKRDVWEDMQLLMKKMGRTIPPRAQSE